MTEISPAPAPAEPNHDTVRVTIEAPVGVVVNVTINATHPGQAEMTHTPPATPRRARPAWPVPPALRAAWQTLAGWWNRWPGSARLRAWFSASPRHEWALFALALAVYGFTRFYALADFPIYFFADEASIAQLAAQVLAIGGIDRNGVFLPVYFEAAALRWTPVISSYLMALTTNLLGNSIEVVRGTSAAVTVLGALALALTLRHIFAARWWWLAVLVLALTPGWLIHSRTGFEGATTASAYALFLLCYLLYRERHPNYLYPALVFGAVVFYTYSNAQVVMAVTALGLLVSDFAYHRQQWRTWLGGAALGLVLAVPFIQFRLNQPAALETHLRMVDSFLFWDIPLSEKAFQFFSNYAYGLSPAYWFFPNTTDLPRHRMLDEGQMLTAFLPFFVMGLGRAFWHSRESRYRAVLIALLAAPAGAAMLAVGFLRVITFIVPAVILIVLGFDTLLAVLRWLWQWRGWPQPTWAGWVVQANVGLGLSIWALMFFFRTLNTAPLWFDNYGLYGMQYGAKQIFQDTLPAWLAREPATRFYLSPNWANAPDALLRFFLSPQQQTRVGIRHIDAYIFRRLNDLDGRTVLIMLPDEEARMRADPRFAAPPPEHIIYYPNGQPGFYFVRPTYTAQADAIFAAEALERQKPLTATVLVQGEPLTLTYPMLGAGAPHHIFDGDTFTLVRGLEANPFYMQVDFPTPRLLSAVTLTTATMPLFAVTARLTLADGGEEVYTQRFDNLPPDPTFDVIFTDGPHLATALRVEITDLRSGSTAQIHIREWAWR